MSSSDNLCFEKTPQTCFLPTLVRGNEISRGTYYNYGCNGVYTDEQVGTPNITVALQVALPCTLRVVADIYMRGRGLTLRIPLIFPAAHSLAVWMLSTMSCSISRMPEYISTAGAEIGPTATCLQRAGRVARPTASSVGATLGETRRGPTFRTDSTSPATLSTLRVPPLCFTNTPQTFEQPTLTTTCTSPPTQQCSRDLCFRTWRHGARGGQPATTRTRSSRTHSSVTQSGETFDFCRHPQPSVLASHNQIRPRREVTAHQCQERPSMHHELRSAGKKHPTLR
jgi:hypothetical protein